MGVKTDLKLILFGVGQLEIMALAAKWTVVCLTYDFKRARSQPLEVVLFARWPGDKIDCLLDDVH